MGQTTPNIGIYIPSAGETLFDQSFASGMVNVDQHDHSGGPNKGLPIATEGLGAFSVTFDKLNINVVDPTTGVGTSAIFQNQIVMLDPLKSIFQLAPTNGFLTLDGVNAHARTFQDTASVKWTNPAGVAGNPSAVVDPTGLVGIVPVANGGTGKSSFTPYAPILAGTTSTAPLQQPASAGNVGEIYVSQGAGAVGQFQPLGGLGQIQYTTFTLSASDILSINTTSIQVLPAQGAGKIIIPLTCYAILNSDGTPFTLASQTTGMGFFYNDLDDTSMHFANGFIKGTTVSNFWWTTQSATNSGSVPANIRNTPLYIGMYGAIIPYLGGGGSSVTFTLGYLVITA